MHCFVDGEEFNRIWVTGLIWDYLELHSIFHIKHVMEQTLKLAFPFVRKTSASSQMINHDRWLKRNKELPQKLYQWIRKELKSFFYIVFFENIVATIFNLVKVLENLFYKAFHVFLFLDCSREKDCNKHC